MNPNNLIIKLNDLIIKLKNFGIECKRVFLVTKKPTKEEFRAIVKVAGLGILIIGFIGFLVHLIGQIIKFR